MIKQSIKLLDLVPKEKLDEILQAVNEACGIGSVIADTEGRPISSESNFSTFCKDFCRATEKGRLKCYESDAYGGKMSRNHKEPYVYDCLNAGLVDCATPIIVAGQHLGNLNGGQVLEESIPREEAIRRAKRIGVTDIDGYLQQLQKIPHVKRTQLQKIVNLMSVITQTISDLALQRILLSLQSKEYLNKLINSVSDCIISLDADFKISMSNHGCSTIFRCSQDILLGKSFFDLVQDKSILNAYKSNLDKGIEDNFRFELTALTHKQTPFPVQISISRVNDESGNVANYVAIVRDITEEKRIAKMKQDLVGMLTHDMRNPILAVDRALELLSRERLGPINERQNKILKLAINTNDQLGGMVNAFLDIFRDENNRFTLNISHNDINSIIEKGLNEYSLLILEKKLRVCFHQKGEKLPCNFDVFRMERVISNIISNAINYSVTGGEIEIQNSIIRGDNPLIESLRSIKDLRVINPQQQYIWIRIADTGFGVPEAYQESIFEKFFTIENEDGLGRRGIGLGLAFSKLVLEAHQGVIFCKTPKRAAVNTRSPGLEFNLLLPFDVAPL